VLLRNRLAQAREPITVRAVVESSMDSEQGSEPWQVMVEAFIRGTEPTVGQDIVLTGHMQEEGTSANDDASGVASALEVARALNRLITDGVLPRPRRNIRFWWVTEISSQRQYFADHPDAHHEMWVNVNQDMVGANQAQDVMRKQNITRLPAARFHFFNDVVESVVEYMVAANNFELAQLQTGIALYPKPHFAHLGTQHRYNAAMIYNHNSTDHMTFNEAPIGVPGVTFTNMPDRYIHSSDDDLWNVDPTQLGRSAAAVGLMAYIMASADSAAVPALSAATIGRGFERLGRNVRLAQSLIAGASDKAAAFQQALDQVWYATNRERLAIASLSEIHPSAVAFVDPWLEELDRRNAQALREVGLTYRQITGERQLPRPNRSETEARLADLRPVLVAGPTEFLTGRGSVSFVPGMHSLMQFEVLNAVDGKRNGFDVARFVAAEAREAGQIYYGTVTLEAVLQYLTNLEEAELIQLWPGAEYTQALALVREGQDLVQSGSVTEAVARYTTAQRRSNKLRITAPSWNTLCWWGGLWNQAAEVVPACDRAVELAPDNANIKDSRGFVRALTGDLEGAIQDFEAFVESSSDAETVAKRQAWIEALRAGQQPVTPEVLAAEREE
jgi:tetratricopeptide (TPR) repeat protein